MMRICILISLGISLVIQGCDNLDRIAFPVVNTLDPEISEDGGLSVELRATVNDLEDEFLNKIVERGFVMATDTIYPTIEHGTVIPADTFTLNAFNVTITEEEGLSYNDPAYFVRAYVRVIDTQRDAIFYDQEFEGFTFSSHLLVKTIAGLTEVRNDTVSVTGLVDSRDYEVNELVSQYGHIFSKSPLLDLSSDSIKVFMTKTDSAEIEDDIIQTVARLEYNENYFFRTVAITSVLDTMLTNDTIYSDIDSFTIRGGFNRVTNIPEKLKSGVVTTTDDGTAAYAGIGSALYKVTRPEDGPFDSLVWTPIPSPVDPGNGRAFTGKTWEGGIAFIAQDSFYYMWGSVPSNRNILNALSLSTGEWTVRNPSDIPQGQAMLPLAARRDAIAFKIDDDEVFFGFGLQNNPMVRQNAMFRFHPGLDSIELFCDPCLEEAVSGQIVNVLNGEAYIATGVLGDVNNIEVTSSMYKFEPENSTNPFVQLTPMPGAGRQNAFSFVLGDRLYVGMGNQADELIVLPDICYYDVNFGTWKLIDEKFPGKPRTNAIAFVLNGRAYIGGGADANGNPLDDMWTYTPPD